MYSPYSASSPELTIAIDIVKPPATYCPLTPPDEEVTFHMEVEIDHEAVILEVKARRESKLKPEVEAKKEMSIETIGGSDDGEPKPRAVSEEPG